MRNFRATDSRCGSTAEKRKLNVRKAYVKTPRNRLQAKSDKTRQWSRTRSDQSRTEYPKSARPQSCHRTTQRYYYAIHYWPAMDTQTKIYHWKMRAVTRNYLQVVAQKWTNENTSSQGDQFQAACANILCVCCIGRYMLATEDSIFRICSVLDRQLTMTLETSTMASQSIQHRLWDVTKHT